MNGSGRRLSEQGSRGEGKGEGAEGAGVKLRQSMEQREQSEAR